jgi:hypothetical protein
LENRAGKIRLDFGEASRAANSVARRRFLTGDNHWSNYFGLDGQRGPIIDLRKIPANPAYLATTNKTSASARQGAGQGKQMGTREGSAPNRTRE